MDTRGPGYNRWRASVNRVIYFLKKQQAILGEQFVCQTEMIMIKQKSFGQLFTHEATKFEFWTSVPQLVSYIKNNTSKSMLGSENINSSHLDV